MAGSPGLLQRRRKRPLTAASVRAADALNLGVPARFAPSPCLASHFGPLFARDGRPPQTRPLARTRGEGPRHSIAGLPASPPPAAASVGRAASEEGGAASGSGGCASGCRGGACDDGTAGGSVGSAADRGHAAGAPDGVFLCAFAPSPICSPARPPWPPASLPRPPVSSLTRPPGQSSQTQVLDAMTRGIQALEHAALVSRSASRAFEDQATALSSAKRAVEMMLLSQRRQ